MAIYAKKYKLNLHYVDIDWSVVEKNLVPLMKQKGAPVHSIEPQIMEAALQAQKDGVEQMVAADGSDLVFGGMDKMLSRDWDFDDWKKFYTFVDPKKVLKNPVDVRVDFLDKLVHPNTGSINFGSAANPIITNNNNKTQQSAYCFAHVDDPYEVYKRVKAHLGK